MSKQLLMVICALVFLAGCWGPEFQSGAEFDDTPPDNTSNTVTGNTTSQVATSGVGGGGSSSATGEPATSTTGAGTTGEAGAGGDDSTASTTGSAGASSTASATASTTGSTGFGCQIPSLESEFLEAVRPWMSYDEAHSRLCAGGAASGTVTCAGYPCALFGLRAEIELLSEDDLVFKVTFQPYGSQHFQMLVDCGSEVTECEYAMELENSAVYFLELRETKDVVVVKSFYAEGSEPTQSEVAMAHSARPVDPTAVGCEGVSNPNIFLQDFWQEYVEWVRALTWECVEQ